jgi:hypothetical protein
MRQANNNIKKGHKEKKYVMTAEDLSVALQETSLF